ncbi:M28 family peptidase [Patescibacteria group bacterium]|jgi:spermidine synthase|nr:M28 family peptidase [Patescibacteria group bacterium]
MDRLRAALVANRLYLVVAITGGAVLAIETLAFRVLSPYYGNTIYSFSSVVTVVLGALSVGYLHGGVLADRFGSYRQFFLLIAAGGGATLLFFTLAHQILPAILTWMPSLVWGPLVGSLLVFFAPAYVLGMLSPYAIALICKEQPEAGIGHIAGRTFAFSTAGSIIGSVGTGFFLIPYVTISTSLTLISLALIVLGLLGLVGYTGLRRGEVSLIVLAAGALAAGSVFASSPTSGFVEGEPLFRADGRYEQIAVYDTTMFGQPARVLLLDRSFSSAINPITRDLVFPYTTYYELYQLAEDPPERALILGGGSATVATVLHDELPGVSIDLVDVEPLLPEISREYFFMPNSPRIQFHTDDARRFLTVSTSTYDLMFSDVYASLFSIPGHVVTEEFFALAADRLAPDGLALFNIIGSLDPRAPSLFYSTLTTIESQFPGVAVFAVQDPHRYQVQNLIVLAAHEPFGAELGERLRAAGLTRFVPHQVDTTHLDRDRYTRFSDDFVPADLYNARMIRQQEVRSEAQFDPRRAEATIEAFMELPRPYLGNSRRGETIDWLEEALSRTGVASVERQTLTRTDSEGRTYTLTNLIGRINPEVADRVLLGSHFDTKRYADRDPDDPQAPVPGANDGGSGVAVILELARQFAGSGLGLDIVLFDGEEGFPELGRSHTEPWKPLGSTYFVEELDALYPDRPPRLVVVPDLVCEHGIEVPREASSVAYGGHYYRAFREVAEEQFPSHFPSDVRYQIGDDHTPFGEAGIPTFLVIDYEYPAFHTTADTLDQCSPTSLMVVGSALELFLENLQTTL